MAIELIDRHSKAHLIGGGIGSLAAATFLIRDALVPGEHITVYEALPLLGGSLDGAGNPEDGYSWRGGRMLTTDNYECTWGLFKEIPSLITPGQSVYEETVLLNERLKSHARARLIDRNRAIVDVSSMGFSIADRVELLTLAAASEEDLGRSRITDWLSPGFFNCNFWHMWQTTFAFQPWHSALEFNRYLHRFIKEFSRIETLAGVKRTIYNQYDSLVCPLVAWLRKRGVRFETGCTVTDLNLEPRGGKIAVTSLTYQHASRTLSIPIGPSDVVFFQNASMTDASSLGSMTEAPPKRTKLQSGGWALWEKLARNDPGFGNPAVFNSSIPESYWASFSVTLKDTTFFDQIEVLTQNTAGTGGLITFKDSAWLLSIVVPVQPHFANQPADIQVFWGYALHPDRVGDFVAKAMADCNGAEILRELCGHLNFDHATVATANCIPCRMPYITSMFMPRGPGDRPLPVPKNATNLAFVSQFVEIPADVVFTVEYSIRVAQIAVYELFGIDLEVPPIHRHDRSFKVQLDALMKAFA